MGSIKVTGSCDSNCGAQATQWFGRTSAATCGKPACVTVQEDRYKEHCAEMDRKSAFEQSMRDEHGADWDS